MCCVWRKGKITALAVYRSKIPLAKPKEEGREYPLTEARRKIRRDNIAMGGMVAQSGSLFYVVSTCIRRKICIKQGLIDSGFCNRYVCRGMRCELSLLSFQTCAQ